MRRPIVTAALLLLLGASTATAQSGLTLYWEGCSDGGALSKTFACNANAGAPFRLYASVVVPQDMPLFAAATAIIDVRFSGPLPAWWQTAPGGCRSSAISMSFDPLNFFTNCPDIWQSYHPLSVFHVEPGFLGLNTVRLNGLGTLPAGNEVDVIADGAELVVCVVTITRTKTVGTGACAGCLTGATLEFIESKLQQPAGVGDYTIGNVAPGYTRTVDWQGGAPTPTQNRTWGAIKGLYH